MSDEHRKIDDIDVQILRALQNNGRITVSEISQTVSMSVPAVSDRIRKLEQANIITGYTAILNPKKLGKEITAVLFVLLEKSVYIKCFKEAVLKEPDVLECYNITGNFDYILKINTKNTASLEQFLAKVKAIPGVQKTNTYIVLATEKNTIPILLD